MAFFIRQVDRRFSAVTALGWAFFNMVLTIVVAFGFSYETYAALETKLFIPMFCGFWIVFFTLGALTLDSNVLLACRSFSKPLRKMLRPNSKDSKDKSQGVSTSGEADSNSTPKVSNSSKIFVLNREMFPSKYEDFDPEMLEQILQELKFQLSSVRRAIPAARSTSTTVIEVSDLGDRARGSTKVDATRLNAKSRFGLTAPSDHRSSHSSEISPRNAEPLATTTSSEISAQPETSISRNAPTMPEPLVTTAPTGSASEISTQLVSPSEVLVTIED